MSANAKREPDWREIANELAYALRIHTYQGRVESENYDAVDANAVALEALARYDEAQEVGD